MLDISFIRSYPERVKQNCVNRRVVFDVDALLALDEKRKNIQAQVDVLRAKRNAMSKTKPTEDKIIALRALGDEIREGERILESTHEQYAAMLKTVPNLTHPDTPVGGEEDFVVLEIQHEAPAFDFEPKDHEALLTNLDMVDFERGAKVAGFRGYFLKNEAVLLSMGLWQFAMDFLVKKGFTPFAAPALIREDIYIGSGKLPLFKDDLYATDDDLYLSSTAEVPMMGYHSDEILNESELPKKFVAISSCYRREAGAHGKDTRGLFRVHEFMKIEQVVLCKAEYQESVKWHEELTQYSEDMLKALGIPYRVVINSTGDLPFAAVKMYDIESWVPSENRYRESHSSSIIRDFQTRRLNIRYRGEDGKVRFAHSLNNTAIATPRILHSLLEIYQNADGSITVPEALRKFVGKEVIGPRK